MERGYKEHAPPFAAQKLIISVDNGITGKAMLLDAHNAQTRGFIRLQKSLALGHAVTL